MTLPFTGGALAEIRAFNEWTVGLCDSLEKIGIDALPARCKEMAMRIALIVALAQDGEATLISETPARWAIAYVKFSMEQTVSLLKMRVSGSEYERDKKEFLQAIRDAGAQGVAKGEMAKTPPFSKHKRRDMMEIMGALAESNLIARAKQPASGRKGGRPKEIWVAIEKSSG